jgi:hypothetical protein
MSRSSYDEYVDDVLREQREILMESIGIYLYKCGGACPVKIIMKALQEWEFYDQIRSAKRTLVRKGYIKRGVHTKTAKLPEDKLLEVFKGKRSPYGYWELTSAGMKWIKTVMGYY